MYHSIRRNHFGARPFGYSWPYHNQYNYRQFINTHTPYYNYPYYIPQFQTQYHNMKGYSPYTPYPTPYQPYPNAYPKNKQTLGVQGVQGILSQFKKKDGTYDINKLMDTAGQMMGAVNQVNSIVKGLTKTFKV
ncbi:YppG family protein [Fredinandcohnia humi]